MKKTDSELQQIKQKLMQLQSSTPVADAVGMPWSSAQQMTSHHPRSARPSTEPSQPSIAIEALKQRSGPSPSNAASSYRAERANHTPTDRIVDDMIAKEIHRLEALAENVNARSQQQATEIAEMKRSAQKAALALARQGIHSHPKLKVLSEFLEKAPSATVPHFGRDSRGRFQLTHTVINLSYAEQEAADTAQALRNRRLTAPLPFSQPLQSDLEAAALETTLPDTSSPRRGSRLVSRSLSQFGRSHLQSSDSDGHPPVNRSNGRFSMTDAAICFCLAAITRIILDALVMSFPLLRMPVVLVLFSLISLAIYRAVVAKSGDLSQGLRLGIILLGLFAGGLF